MMSDPESEKEKRRRAFAKALSEDTEDLELNYEQPAANIVTAAEEPITDAATRIAAFLDRTLPKDVAGRDEAIEFVKNTAIAANEDDRRTGTRTVWVWPFPNPST